ncbi:unnamed protein product, partial [marine sediment metagenome]
LGKCFLFPVTRKLIFPDIAILYPVEQDNLESSLITLRRARALLAMEDIQKEAVNKGLDKTTEEEIEKEIKAMRLERSR